MSSQYYSIITNRGKELEAESIATGKTIKLKDFVVGDGNGSYVTPDPVRTSLVHKVYQGAISKMEVSAEQSNQCIAYLVLPADIGGFVVREVGLLTDAGELYATGNCAAIEKPASGVNVTLQFRLAVSESANITLIVSTGDGLFLRQDANLSDVKDKAKSRQNLELGTAAQRDATTGPTDATSGRLMQVGGGGLMSTAISMLNSNLNDKAGFPGAFFRCGTNDHFDEYGSGVHLLYGPSGDGINTLTANMFVGASGNLYVEWLSVNKTTGVVTVQNIQKLYGPLNKPTSDDVGALSVNGGLVTGNAAVIDIRQKTGDESYYIRGTKRDGSAHYYLGQGAASSNEVSLFNNKLGSGISLSAGGVKVTGQIIPSDLGNLDERYQAKGNYTPAGEAYTKSQSDARYNFLNSGSRSTNGWHKDGSTGFIIEWGTVTIPASNSRQASSAFTFSTAYPSNVLSVTASAAMSGVNGNGFISVPAVTSLSRTGGTIVVDSNSGENFTNSQTIRYLAVGY